jgi:hypothetical protein
MKSYSVIKEKAQQFANDRNKPVYIAKARNQYHYKIEFSDETSKNYEIIETIYPEDTIK